jgi:hypothetical protein
MVSNGAPALVWRLSVSVKSKQQRIAFTRPCLHSGHVYGQARKATDCYLYISMCLWILLLMTSGFDGLVAGSKEESCGLE